MRPAPPLPPLPPLPSAGSARRTRAPEEDVRYGVADDVASAPAARRPAARTGDRRPDRSRPDGQRPDDGRPGARGAVQRSGPTPPRVRSGSAPESGGLRGIVAVLGVFLVTLAGGAVDSLFMGMGLGLITLGCLVGSTVLAAALVRRRDVLSVVIAPPLVFGTVACANILVAPSATFSLPTIATLLVRGFPTMAMATGAAFAIALIRWAGRR